ncbi:MAG TPA: GTP cyclohydrolase II [Candidatus Competibacteraceae bacterium]|nr:GTP cyclohydrolase II [Candidatus Competibacteraceae bacterium]
MLTPTSTDHHSVVLQVDRVLAELRRGQAVRVCDGEGQWMIVAVETSGDFFVQELYKLTDEMPRLLLSPLRAQVLGLAVEEGGAYVFAAPSDANGEWYRQLAFRRRQPLTPGEIEATAAGAALARLLALAKHARLLPALLLVRRPAGERGTEPVLAAELIDAYPHSLACSLRPVVDTRVPLAASEQTRFVLFRAADGHTEHVAIVVGEPDLSGPVLVRLHSACFTGDLFSSLKCDCGEQLRSAVLRMTRCGGGILLYLHQEGRGIGLANKLRAYQLQAEGYDTVDADATLGFEQDERRFDIAGEMLKQLGVRRVRLLTNNPRKLQALEAAGLSVEGRLPVLGSVNPHNERYLRTKASRAGHLFDANLTPFRWRLAGGLSVCEAGSAENA